MRPLPTYRIEPPDIIQIEVTSAKAARGGENQPAKKSDEVKPSGSAATESGSSSLNVSGAITPAENKSGGSGSQVSGKIISQARRRRQCTGFDRVSISRQI